MVGAVRLTSLALFAEPELSIALDCKGTPLGGVLCREEAVAHIVRRRAGRCKDGGGIGPVEHEVERNTYYRRAVAYPAALPANVANTDHHPYSP